jgi:hypothetical protein
VIIGKRKKIEYNLCLIFFLILWIIFFYKLTRRNSCQFWFIEKEQGVSKKKKKQKEKDKDMDNTPLHASTASAPLSAIKLIS